MDMGIIICKKTVIFFTSLSIVSIPNKFKQEASKWKMKT
ncbi:hypothetical protein FM106_05920 [Brachybacterium faecium]|nr:hypothetical protein FM106_05920 [Brachybacterium faecium]